ncbi:MAG: hypothetical protein EOP38_15420 [Rubrivivax sp.]|nr:MAG: hypothetical protein EOP38_15420 [Rubrivivax sp.]
MGQQTTPVQAPALEHCIRLSAVRTLLGARVFTVSKTARWVTVSGHCDTGDCGRGRVNTRLSRERLGVGPTVFGGGISATSDVAILHLVERTRTAHGPAEVKRTWGIGYREFRAQLTQGRA